MLTVMLTKFHYLIPIAEASKVELITALAEDLRSSEEDVPHRAEREVVEIPGYIAEEELVSPTSKAGQVMAPPGDEDEDKVRQVE